MASRCPSKIAVLVLLLSTFGSCLRPPARPTRSAGSLASLSGRPRAALSRLRAEPGSSPDASGASEPGEAGETSDAVPAAPAAAVEVADPVEEAPVALTARERMVSAAPLAYVITAASATFLFARKTAPLELFQKIWEVSSGEPVIAGVASLVLSCAVLQHILPVVASTLAVKGAAEKGLDRIKSETYRRLNLAIAGSCLLRAVSLVAEGVGGGAASKHVVASGCVAFLALGLVASEVWTAAVSGGGAPSGAFAGARSRFSRAFAGVRSSASALLTSELVGPVAWLRGLSGAVGAAAGPAAKLGAVASALAPRPTAAKAYRLAASAYLVRVVGRMVLGVVCAVNGAVGPRVAALHVASAATDVLPAAMCYCMWDATRRGREGASTFRLLRKALVAGSAASLVWWTAIGVNAGTRLSLPYMLPSLLINGAIMGAGLQLQRRAAPAAANA